MALQKKLSKTIVRGLRSRQGGLILSPLGFNLHEDNGKTFHYSNLSDLKISTSLCYKIPVENNALKFLSPLLSMYFDIGIDLSGEPKTLQRYLNTYTRDADATWGHKEWIASMGICFQIDLLFVKPFVSFNLPVAKFAENTFENITIGIL